MLRAITSSGYSHMPVSNAPADAATICGTPLSHLRHVGSGACCRVYAAKNKEGTEVAVKFYLSKPSPGTPRPSAAGEAAVWSTLEHPNIARLLGAQLLQDSHPGSATGRWMRERGLTGEYLVAELAAGGELFGALPQPADTAVMLLEQVMAAVAFMHGRGVYHGDIKPENIVLNDDRTVCKLIDFGYAGRADAERVPRGSAFYSDPRVFKTKGNVDMLANDVFGVGSTLFATITGVAMYDLHNGRPVYAEKSLVKDPRCAQLVQSFTAEDQDARPKAQQAQQQMASCLLTSQSE